MQLAGKQTGPIRTTIEADSQQEAEVKFKAFLLRKAEPVVSFCQVAPPLDDFAKIMQMFGDIFKSK